MCIGPMVYIRISRTVSSSRRAVCFSLTTCGIPQLPKGEGLVRIAVRVQCVVSEFSLAQLTVYLAYKLTLKEVFFKPSGKKFIFIISGTVEQCFSNFNVLMNHLVMLLKYRF